jgi:hypothetical protein
VLKTSVEKNCFLTGASGDLVVFQESPEILKYGFTFLLFPPPGMTHTYLDLLFEEYQEPKPQMPTRVELPRLFSCS